MVPKSLAVWQKRQVYTTQHEGSDAQVDSEKTNGNQAMWQPKKLTQQAFL